MSRAKRNWPFRVGIPHEVGWLLLPLGVVELFSFEWLWRALAHESLGSWFPLCRHLPFVVFGIGLAIGSAWMVLSRRGGTPPEKKGEEFSSRAEKGVVISLIEYRAKS